MHTPPEVAARRRWPAVLAAALIAAALVPLLSDPAAAGTSTLSNTTPLLTEVVRTAEPYKTTPNYPSTINVSGLTGVVSKVTVKLHDFAAQDRDPGTPETAGWAEDADILLEAPGNTKNLVLLSDIGGANEETGAESLVGVDINLTDSAAAGLPTDTALTSNTSITAKPTDDDNDPDESTCCSWADPFSNPNNPSPEDSDGYSFSGPTAKTATTLATFKGIVPNGAWDLWMVDDFGGPESVALDGGWSITITTEPAPSLAISNASVTEGDSGTTTATFTVTLSAASTRTVKVTAKTANGSATAPPDYQALTTTLSFAPGETSKSVSVPVNGDTAVESSETFKVNLSNPLWATIADSQGIATIVNDD